MSKDYYNDEEALDEAKENLKQAQNAAEWIFLQRQMESNMQLLIERFYYSLYYCMVGILTLKTNEKFKRHESAINAFNYLIYSTDYLDHSFVASISILRGLREEYDYHDADIDEEKYLLAEKLWNESYPELENELISLIQQKEK